MASQYSDQIDQDARRERRQHVEALINKLRQGLAQRAIVGDGSFDEWDIDDLARELDGMRKHIRRTLSAPKPDGLGSRQEAEALEALLFSNDPDAAKQALKSRLNELKQFRVDRTAQRASKIHVLILQARAVLPEIEAAREAHYAQEAAEREAEFQARVTEAKAAGTLREFTGLGCRNEVRRLIEEHTGQTYYDWNSASALFGDAVRLGVITDLEYRVAERAYGRGWTYAGD